MDVLVDFSDSLLDQHRSFTHDAILIYGFIPEKTLIGEIKARFTIEDGLTSWSEWSVCSTICGKGTETRSRACSFDDALNVEALTDERSCHPEDCKFFSRNNFDFQKTAWRLYRLSSKSSLRRRYSYWIRRCRKDIISYANLSSWRAVRSMCKLVPRSSWLGLFQLESSAWEWLWSLPMLKVRFQSLVSSSTFKLSIWKSC